jgi:hypothetical protein
MSSNLVLGTANFGAKYGISNGEYGLLALNKQDWLQIEETTFKERFSKSPLLRSKLKGIKRNIEYLKNRS